MVNAAIYVPQALVRDSQYIGNCVTRIGHLGYHFTELILRDWMSVERCLRDGIIDVVIDSQGEHRPAGWRPDAAESIAPVLSLDRQRAETVTRRLPRNQSGRHRAGNARNDMVGMTSGRVRRIIDGDEPAPDDFDRSTVDALRSIASKLALLEELERFW